MKYSERLTILEKCSSEIGMNELSSCWICFEEDVNDEETAQAIQTTDAITLINDKSTPNEFEIENYGSNIDNTDENIVITQDAVKKSKLLSTGCACRGSGGFAHVKCMVQAAIHDVKWWTTCPMCKQYFTGEMEVGLAKARWERVRHRRSDDPERLFVCNNLAVTLHESAGDPDGALKLFKEVLAVRRLILGDEHPDTLDSITNLALQHTERGNYDEALALSEDVVEVTRRILESNGNNDEIVNSSHALISLAAVHNLMGNHEQAKPMYEEVLEIRSRILGKDHLDTMNAANGLGHCLVYLGEYEEGLASLQVAVDDSTRVLGVDHPSTKYFVEGLVNATELAFEDSD